MQYLLFKEVKTEHWSNFMNDQALYKSSFDNCPLTFVLNLIGGKWRLPVIWALHKNGTTRYNELKRNIEGITNMMLTQSLKELELHVLSIGSNLWKYHHELSIH